MSPIAAGMTVDVVRAESSRFRHPLLMIHGLWTGGWIWRQFAPYLAHRGWDSLAPSFLAAAWPADVNARRRTLVDLCAGLPAPPILVTHDAGIAIAATLARDVAIPAIVALAPLFPRLDGHGVGVFAHPQFWGARLFNPRVAPPRGQAARLLLRGLPNADVQHLRPDSGDFFRALVAGRCPVPSGGLHAGLVLSSSNDAVSSDEQGRRIAEQCHWSVDVHETTGHFPMLAPGWETLADRVHRWLVHALGADLLAWIDDEGDAE